VEWDEERGIEILTRRKIVCPGFCSGSQRLVGSWIMNHGKGDRIFGTTALLNYGSHPVTFAFFSASINEDIHSLTDPEWSNGLSISNTRNEICRNDIHLVSINAEMLKTFRTSINETKTMPLPRFEVKLRKTGIGDTWISGIGTRTIEVILSIDEIVI